MHKLLTYSTTKAELLKKFSLAVIVKKNLKIYALKDNGMISPHLWYPLT